MVENEAKGHLLATDAVLPIVTITTSKRRHRIAVCRFGANREGGVVVFVTEGSWGREEAEGVCEWEF